MKLSVIMPVYNGAKYIQDTIPSILRSEKSDFELILVNDGSKDNSLEVCRQYAMQDRRIKAVSKTNGGIAEARNYGVKSAEGEYLAFVDQDDYFELDTIMKILDSHNEDVVIFSTVRDYGSHSEACDTVNLDTVYQTPKEIFECCIWPMVYPLDNVGNVSYLGHVWQAVYKRKNIEDANLKFQQLVSIEDDYIFLFEALIHANSVAMIPKVGYRWVVNHQSTTYKIAYIDGMKEKCEEYYSYIDHVLSQVCYYNSDYRNKYIRMSKQILGVRLVINEGNNCSLINSFKLLNAYVRENRSYFNGEYLGRGASRKSAKALFVLLKHQLVFTSLALQKCIIWGKMIERGGKKQ